MTLKELSKNLDIFLKKYPNLEDKEVVIACECGHSSAGIQNKFEVAVPVATEDFKDEIDWCRIISDDDGLRTNRAIKDWIIYKN